jgi:tetratricopeptide (TPR) repeat protein
LDKTGNGEQAIETLRRGLNFLGQSAAMDYELGMLYQNRGLYEHAIPHFQSSLVKGNIESAYVELILCYEESDRAEECLDWLGAHADANPFDAAAWYHFGLACTKYERYETAVDAFLNAIALEDDNFAHHYALALVYVELNRYSQAIPALLDALLLCPQEKGILMFLGQCYEALGRPAFARMYYMRCKKHHPQDPEAWHGIGSTFEAEGKYIQAVFYYEKALALDENYYDALLGLAASEYELGNELSAREALEKAIAYMPEDLMLWDEWAERLDNDGRTAEALEFVRRGLGFNPRSSELVYRMAALAFKLGRTSEALSAFESGLLMFFDGHESFFDMCPDASSKPAFRALVDRYRP